MDHWQAITADRWCSQIPSTVFTLIFAISLVVCTTARDISAFFTAPGQAAIHGILILGGLFLASSRRPCSRERFLSGIACLYVLGALALVSTTPVPGNVWVYFTGATAFASLFSGRKPGAFVLGAGTLFVLAAGHLHFRLSMGIAGFEGQTLPHWALTVAVFFLLNLWLLRVLPDITGQTRLMKSLSRLSWEHSRDLVWIHDQDLTILYVNRTISQLLGYMPDQWCGTHFLSHLAESSISEPLSYIMKPGAPPMPGHAAALLKRRDSTTLTAEITGFWSADDSGTRHWFTGSARAASFADLPAEEPGRVKQALAQAKKMEAQEILSGGVAHDLNNILSGITTYPEILLMDKNLDDTVRQGLTLIKDSGRKAADIVSDLLTISRGSTAEVTVINMNTVVENYLASAEHSKLKARYADVTITANLAPDLMHIRSSYIHVEKSLMNLVTNALEEINGNINGNVTITTENRRLDKAVHGYEKIGPGEYSVLSVADNGSGIDREALKRIFEPYYSKKVMGRSGTGLGLTIVKNTVQTHRGHIDVSSDSSGTRIMLYFPSVRETPAEIRASISMDEVKGSGQSILVVDDFVTQIDIACSILSRLGYVPLRAESGEEAVEIIRSTHVDLVILDMIMYPGMDGLETYREMIAIQPGLKAVIASGHDKSDDVVQAQGLGAGQFIKKPYTIIEMGKAIKEELEK